MVLNGCNVCAVYESGDEVQKRVQVKCNGEQITLLLKREHELSDSSRVRIDFFDSQIGCVKTYCEISVRKNIDPSLAAAWVADCEIMETIEIVEGRRSIRAQMEKEAVFSIQEDEEFDGVIQNISEGGIYFITTKKLSCNDTVGFLYSFIEEEHYMEVTILREEIFRDGRYGYGCQFLVLSREAQRDIKQYVYLRRQGRVF